MQTMAAKNTVTGCLIVDTSCDAVKSVLKTNTGKFLTIRMVNSIMTLCVEETQNESIKAPLVDILTCEKNFGKKALKFHYKEDRYWVKADTDKKELKLIKDGDSQAEPSWFETENARNGRNFTLRLADQSTPWYLCTRMKGEREIVTVMKDRLRSILVTAEKRN